MSNHCIQEHIIRAVNVLRDIDMQQYESAHDEQSELVERLHDGAKLASEAFEEVLEVYGAGDPDPGETLLDVSTHPLSDMAFLAECDLRQQLRRLRAMSSQGSDPMLILAQCESVRGLIMRVLASIDCLLCELEDLTPQLDGLQAQAMKVALESRDAYLNFHHGIRSLEQHLADGDYDLGYVLRLAGANLAKLVGREIYRKLRLLDRRQLSTLQARIIRHQREGSEDELEARRLWMDITACTQLLGQINRRTELIEHDCELLAATLDALDAQPEAADASALRTLEGRCPDLDALLADVQVDVLALRPRLLQMHDELAIAIGRTPRGDAPLASMSGAWSW